MKCGPKGYGFAMRGVKGRYVETMIIIITYFFLISATKAMRFTPTPQVPALQYIGSVEKGSSSDLAGLQTGDFLLEVSPLLSHSLPLTIFKSTISSHISLSNNSLRIKHQFTHIFSLSLHRSITTT